MIQIFLSKRCEVMNYKIINKCNAFNKLAVNYKTSSGKYHNLSFFYKQFQTKEVGGCDSCDIFVTILECWSRYHCFQTDKVSSGIEKLIN